MKRQQRFQAAAVLAVIPLLAVGTWISAGSNKPDLAGTLNNDVVSIGAETTGWGITSNGAGGGFVEVDISAVRAEAAALCGKPVHAWGKREGRNGVERGYSVFVVSRLAPAN